MVLGFHRLSNIKSAHTFQETKDALLQVEISMDHCRGQAYDGVSNILGKNSGVAARTKADHSKSTEAHCRCHCWKLGVESVSNVPMGMIICTGTSLERFKLIKHSHERKKKLGKNIEFNFCACNPNPTCRRFVGSQSCRKHR